MVDVLTPDQRRFNMSRIRNANTAPELLIRRGLHTRGYRFRLHRKDIPGCPDLTLPKYRSVIFVNGCFWHGHECPMFKIPETREAFWKAKIQKNRDRDAYVLSALSALGWRTLVLWECSIKGPGRRPLDTVLNDVATWLAGEDARGTLSGRR
jgi:DNA mismatch endonuclease (patch repair protein)